MNFLAILLLSVAAALITYDLNNKHKLGPVRASSLVSLIFGLIVYFLKINPIYGAAVMGASFAAMSTDKVIPNKVLMTICGIIFSLVFFNLSSESFAGFGGRLGTTACISVIMTLGMIKMIGGCRKYHRMLQCGRKKIFK
ncbi:MAG: hypothetical protein Q8N77_00190 [Nanoarchaeota archaeon]|nr:hypothetical protein [Nanoarchaeota archaeon]